MAFAAHNLYGPQMAQKAQSVLIVDDNAFVRAVLRSFLEMKTDLEVVGEASDGSEAVQKARELNPDVVILLPADTLPNEVTSAGAILQQFRSLKFMPKAIAVPGGGTVWSDNATDIQKVQISPDGTLIAAWKVLRVQTSSSSTS